MGRLLNTGISIGTIGNPQLSFEVNAYDNKARKIFINIQLFAINKQKQSRHNESNNTGRSILFGGEEAAQRIIDNYSGKGQMLPGNKERVKTDKPIGYYISNSRGERVLSNVAIIVHSKTGDHVYPGKPNGGDNNVVK